MEVYLFHGECLHIRRQDSPTRRDKGFLSNLYPVLLLVRMHECTPLSVEYAPPMCPQLHRGYFHATYPRFKAAHAAETEIQMKKKQLANLIMVAIICVIAVAGVLTVGHIQGWFDKADASQAVIGDIRGVVNLQRNGVIFPAENDTVLRSGDQLTCNSGATAVIRLGDDYLTIGDKADLKINDPSADNFSSEVNGGEVFIKTVKTMTFTFEGQRLVVANAVASLSVRAGAQSVNVYEGTVENATAGQMLNYLSGETSVQELSINSLNPFLISQIRTANKTTTLCFTAADLDKLLADRNQAIQDILNNTKPSEEASSVEAESSTAATDDSTTEGTEPDNSTDADGPDNSTETDEPDSSTEVNEPDHTTEADVTESETTEPTTTKPDESKPHTPTTEVPSTEAPTTETPTTEAPTTEAPTPEAPSTETPTTEALTTEFPTTEAPTTEAPSTEPDSELHSCIITIRCDTILNNWDALDPSKVEFVPEDGMILYPVTVSFEEGETVFEVLKRVCDQLGIQLEYSYTPLYESYYIEGINNLYEFDCGNESGWMYKVNGWFPNYGCSSYYLEDGDVIEWLYTCNGLGADVGGPSW